MVRTQSPKVAAERTRSALVRFIADRRDLGTLTPGNIDEATFIDGEPGLIVQRFGTDVSRGAPFFVRGWAVDLGRRTAPWGIRIEIDGSVVDAQVKIGDERPDIVKLVGTPAVLRCGFRAYFSTAGLTVGPHELRVRAIVGRRGSAFARLPPVAQLFVGDHLPAVFSPPTALAATTPWFRLDPVAPVAAGAVLALSGWALDMRGQPLCAVAARLDGDAWHAGWTGVRRGDLAVKGSPPMAARAGFGVRIRLDAVAPGTHGLQIAGQTATGRWIVLQPPCFLTVTFPDVSVSRWLRPLVSAGEAFITDVDGSSDAAWSTIRLGAHDSCQIRGLMRRSSQPGAGVTVVARSAARDQEVPGWSAPTGNPHVLVYGARIDAALLGPGKHQILVDAPDAAGRCLGRADTGCSVFIERSAGLTAR